MWWWTCVTLQPASPVRGEEERARRDDTDDSELAVTGDLIACWRRGRREEATRGRDINAGCIALFICVGSVMMQISDVQY